MKADDIRKFLKSKPVKIVLICLAALALLLAVWKVFFASEPIQSDAYKATEEEKRLASLLEKIDGVTDATVMIGRNGETTSVVVIFEGTDGILTRLRITEVAASALGVVQSNVIVYAA